MSNRTQRLVQTLKAYLLANGTSGIFGVKQVSLEIIEAQVPGSFRRLVVVHNLPNVLKSAVERIKLICEEKGIDIMYTTEKHLISLRYMDRRQQFRNAKKARRPKKRNRDFHAAVCLFSLPLACQPALDAVCDAMDMETD